MYKPYFPVIMVVSRESIDGTNFTSRTPKQKPGQIWRFTGVSLRNNDTAGVRIDIGVQTGSTIYYLKTINLVSAEYWYFWVANILMPSDWRVCFRYKSPTSGDKFDFYVMGNIEPGPSKYTPDG